MKVSPRSLGWALAVDHSLSSWPLRAEYGIALVSRPARRRSALSFGDGFMFVLASTYFIRLEFVGQLLGSDLIVLAALPILLAWRGNELRSKAPRTAIALGLGWLVAQISTDLVRGSAFHDYARSWSKIGLTLAYFAVFYMLAFRNRRRLAMGAIGISAGGILGYFLQPTMYAPGDAWKFGVGVGVTTGIVFATAAFAKWFRPPNRVQAGVVGLAGVLNLVLGYRALGGVCLVSAVLLLSGDSARRHWRRLLVAGAAAVLVLASYSYVARRGTLGDVARLKYEDQATGRFGVLLGGRDELLASAQAIVDSPLIGHGSWAQDAKYPALLAQRQVEYGYNPSSDSPDLIPTHSYLFGAWVEAGLMGALFWGFVFWGVLRALAKPIAVAEPLRPFIMFTAVMFAWNILFSPYGQETRLLAAYAIVLIMSCLEPGRPTYFHASFDRHHLV